MRRMLVSLGALVAGLALVTATPSAAAERAGAARASVKVTIGASSEIDHTACSSAGNCVASGEYGTSMNVQSSFVLSEVAGKWGKPQAVPAFGGSTTGQILGLACARGGSCTAVGDMGFQRPLGFLLTEVGGVWSAPTGIPGPLGDAAGSYGVQNWLQSVSCPAVNDCILVGDYDDASGNPQPLVVTESGGTWQDAVQLPVPATSALSDVVYLSCGSTTSCVAGFRSYSTAGKWGTYLERGSPGAWSTLASPPVPKGVTGTTELGSITCVGGSQCLAIGDYLTDGGRHTELYADTETGGTWQSAPPIVDTFDTGHQATLLVVSCASPGNCVAGGDYESSKVQLHALVVTETHGVWSRARSVTSNLEQNYSEVTSISCASVGNCSATGTIGTSIHNKFEASNGFVIDERGGSWGAGIDLTGAKNEAGIGGINSVTCSSNFTCIAGGAYYLAVNHVSTFEQTELATRAGGKWAA